MYLMYRGNKEHKGYLESIYRGSTDYEYKLGEYLFAASCEFEGKYQGWLPTSCCGHNDFYIENCRELTEQEIKYFSKIEWQGCKGERYYISEERLSDKKPIPPYYVLYPKRV